MTPLHFAATNGHDEVVMTIIKNGAYIDAQNFVSITELIIDTRIEILYARHKSQQ